MIWPVILITAVTAPGWRYSPQRGCIGTTAAAELSVTPTATELSSGVWTPARLDALVETFRLCGVLALPSAAPREAAEAFGSALRQRVQPILASRGRVRRSLAHAMSRGANLRALWSEQSLEEELLFRVAATFRERHAGRIDVKLPWEEPFSAPKLALAPLLLALLQRLLGPGASLKSVHAIVSLPGAEAQSWHRDAPLLFDDESSGSSSGTPRAERVVHAARGGVHLPPFALNVFAPLADVSADAGPTEFVLGSHMWAPIWAEDEAVEEGGEEKRWPLPAGSFVIADYRTVHRGGANRGLRNRALAMYVWGRPWWHDSVNYGAFDEGVTSSSASGSGDGADVALREIEAAAKMMIGAKTGQREESEDEARAAAAARATPPRNYWGLVNKWEEELRRGLEQGREFGGGDERDELR